MKRKLSKNYLLYIPVRNENYSWETNQDARVVVAIPRTGFFNRVAQKFFHKPKVSYIHLDEMGSFIWLLIDGVNTIESIAQQVKRKFGKKAEPLYNRLVTYFKILDNNSLIHYKKER